ncbi:ammecr1 [Anaeramoeba flamelloides]|uniref:Ammecr1 n=1 Tax=Anaeramoeba flamelloides TaxID=1746091 RepID=A0ABQ8YR67_9EUKA|nr:ammecr1 [Anaeramoeba flamelloides]
MTDLVATKEMCYYCFDTLANHFENKKPFKLDTKKYKAPLFVTWKKEKGSKWKLRGCKGTFSPKKLSEGLSEISINSAFRDRRFQPIKQKEIKKLRCHINLLTNFENGDNYLDWEPGVHGIRIYLKNHRATYLPDVSINHFQGDKEETIQHLIKKAGIKKTINQKLKNQIVLERYQSSKNSCTYQEYIEYINSKK